MESYVLTVFSKSGEKLLDETFTAENDAAAKVIGKERLEAEGYAAYTHRCVTSKAKLILFHR